MGWKSEIKNRTTPGAQQWPNNKSDFTNNVFYMKRSKPSSARWSYFNFEWVTDIILSFLFFTSCSRFSWSCCFFSLRINRKVEYVFFFFWTGNLFWSPITSSKEGSRWQAMTQPDMHTAKMTHHKKNKIKPTVEVMVTSAQCAQKHGGV